MSRLLLHLGAAGLLLAMAVDGLAVFGRHVGWPLLGSIELVQVAILLASSVAIVYATLAGRHARVSLLIDRIPEAARDRLQRIHGLLSAAYFSALALGAGWIALGLWQGHEESELLHIPYAPLRFFNILAVIVVALLFLGRAARR